MTELGLEECVDRSERLSGGCRLACSCLRGSVVSKGGQCVGVEVCYVKWNLAEENGLREHREPWVFEESSLL